MLAKLSVGRKLNSDAIVGGEHKGNNNILT